MNVSYIKTDSTKLDTVSKQDGQIISEINTNENNKLYIDFKDESTNIVKRHLIGQSSGSSGSSHTIIDKNGTSMTGRSNLQFIGATLTDDATNDKTVVSVDVTNQIAQSEPKPVSSGAVYTAIGNIETLLANI